MHEPTSTEIALLLRLYAHGLDEVDSQRDLDGLVENKLVQIVPGGTPVITARGRTYIDMLRVVPLLGGPQKGEVMINWKLWWHYLWHPGKFTERLVVTQKDLAKSALFEQVVQQRDKYRCERDRLRALLVKIDQQGLEWLDWPLIHRTLLDIDD